ncbi:MAG: glycoside hydrolase family 25 protein [Patescibacteria group bacterium]|nr:glycoside hydrolase family 25 protein [Patescibacteria group bacterium]
MRAAGHRFVFLKATEGTGFIDPYFAADWEAVKAAGLVRGAYHFAHPETNTPEAEAAFFLKAIPSLEPGDVLILDIEVESAGNFHDWASRWLALVHAESGIRPWLYSYASWLTGHGLAAPDLAGYPLWLAAYQETEPPVVQPWPCITCWQYTDAETLPGVPGQVDASRWYGQ